MYGEDKNSHTYSLTIQINVNLPKKTPRGLALGKRDNTVCLQEHNKIFFYLAESLHNFFTKEYFL